MRTMRLLSLISLTIVAACFSGCRDASVVPYDEPSDAIKRILIQKWIFDDTSQSSGDSVKIRKGWVLEIKSDGSYTSSSPSSASSSGRWSFNGSDSTITLVPGDGSRQSTFKIDSISDKTIILRNNASQELINLRSKTGPLFSISGPIVFEKSIPIPVSHRLSVVWKANGLGDASFVWGEGSIDEIGSRYHIDFNSYPPDSLIAKFYGCQGKIGVGTIFLHTDPKIGKNGASFQGSVPMNSIGIVKDRALMFLFGQFEGTQCTVDFPWVASFSRGFSVGEAYYGVSERDKFIPAMSTTHSLVITDSPQTFQTPQWWK